MGRYRLHKPKVVYFTICININVICHVLCSPVLYCTNWKINTYLLICINYLGVFGGVWSILLSMLSILFCIVSTSFQIWHPRYCLGMGKRLPMQQKAICCS